jgi:hypothetical protein
MINFIHIHQKKYVQESLPKMRRHIWEIDSTTSISTSLSARNLTVHFDFPSGVSEQARRANCASILPSILVERHCGLFHAVQNPNHSRNILFLFYLLLTYLILAFSAIALSSRPLSAGRSILARVRLLAEDCLYEDIASTLFVLFLSSELHIIYSVP